MEQEDGQNITKGYKFNVSRECFENPKFKCGFGNIRISEEGADVNEKAGKKLSKT